MDAINQHLKSWAEGVVGANVSVSHDFLEAEKDKRVTLFLYEILPSASRQKKPGARLQITLRYLVSATAKSIRDSHLLLEKLIFKAMQSKEFDLELMPADPSVFLSLGIKSRPCFWLCVDHFQERKAVPVSLVTEKVDLRLSSQSSLSGRVKSENGIPIVDAKINVSNENMHTATDINGCFQLSAIPPQPANIELVIRYQQFTNRVNISLNESPIDILFKPLKERQ